jgi:transcriptional regulator with XRE-family HTH domain
METKFSDRLETLVRVILKDNAESFAHKAGVSGPTVRQIIAGNTNPSMDTLEKISQYALSAVPNLNVSWLTVGEGDPLNGAAVDRFMEFVDNDATRPKIWDAVKSRMNELGMKQRDLAERTGYGEARISNILNEKLKKYPRMSFFPKLLEAIEMNEEQLLNRAGLITSSTPYVRQSPAMAAEPRAGYGKDVRVLEEELAKKDMMIQTLKDMLHDMQKSMDRLMAINC